MRRKIYGTSCKQGKNGAQCLADPTACSQKEVEEMLLNYDGTVIAVSHVIVKCWEM